SSRSAATLWDDLNAANAGISVRRPIGAGGEGDSNLPAAVGRGRKHFLRRLKLRAGVGKDVVVGQDRGAVDGYIECALASPRESRFRKVQAHRKVRPWRQIGNGVGGGRPPLSPVDRLRGGIGDAGYIDYVWIGVCGSAAETCVLDEIVGSHQASGTDGDRLHACSG